MEKIEQKLLDMKEKLDQAKSELDKTRGALEQEFLNLKKEFKVKTLKDAQTLLNMKQTQQEDLFQALEDKVKEMEARYDWGNR